MKRLLTTLTLAGSLAVGGFVGSPTPADAHTVPGSTTYAICDLGRDAFAPAYALSNWRTIHYGSAHVTQCEVNYAGVVWRCFQHVWYVGWDEYDPAYPAPYCW
jgi:hypothetical protein